MKRKFFFLFTILILMISKTIFASIYDLYDPNHVLPGPYPECIMGAPWISQWNSSKPIPIFVSRDTDLPLSQISSLLVITKNTSGLEQLWEKNNNAWDSSAIPININNIGAINDFASGWNNGNLYAFLISSKQGFYYWNITSQTTWVNSWNTHSYVTDAAIFSNNAMFTNISGLGSSIYSFTADDTKNHITYSCYNRYLTYSLSVQPQTNPCNPITQTTLTTLINPSNTSDKIEVVLDKSDEIIDNVNSGRYLYFFSYANGKWNYIPFAKYQLNNSNTNFTTKYITANWNENNTVAQCTFLTTTDGFLYNNNQTSDISYNNNISQISNSKLCQLLQLFFSTYHFQWDDLTFCSPNAQSNTVAAYDYLGQIFIYNILNNSWNFTTTLPSSAIADSPILNVHSNNNSVTSITTSSDNNENLYFWESDLQYFTKMPTTLYSNIKNNPFLYSLLSLDPINGTYLSKFYENNTDSNNCMAYLGNSIFTYNGSQWKKLLTPPTFLKYAQSITSNWSGSSCIALNINLSNGISYYWNNINSTIQLSKLSDLPLKTSNPFNSSITAIAPYYNSASLASNNYGILVACSDGHIYKYCNNSIFPTQSTYSSPSGSITSLINFSSSNYPSNFNSGDGCVIFGTSNGGLFICNGLLGTPQQLLSPGQLFPSHTDYIHTPYGNLIPYTVNAASITSICAVQSSNNTQFLLGFSNGAIILLSLNVNNNSVMCSNIQTLNTKHAMLPVPNNLHNPTPGGEISDIIPVPTTPNSYYIIQQDGNSELLYATLSSNDILSTHCVNINTSSFSSISYFGNNHYALKNNATISFCNLSGENCISQNAQLSNNKIPLSYMAVENNGNNHYNIILTDSTSNLYLIHTLMSATSNWNGIAAQWTLNIQNNTGQDINLLPININCNWNKDFSSTTIPNSGSSTLVLTSNSIDTNPYDIFRIQSISQPDIFYGEFIMGSGSIDTAIAEANSTDNQFSNNGNTINQPINSNIFVSNNIFFSGNSVGDLIPIQNTINDMIVPVTPSQGPTPQPFTISITHFQCDPDGNISLNMSINPPTTAKGAKIL